MRFLRILPLLGLLASVPAGAEELPLAPTGSDPAAEVAALVERPTLGLEDLFRLAELTNPELALARGEVLRDEGLWRQAGLWPNPEITVAVEEMSLDDSSFHKKKLELSQALSLSGRRGREVGAARALWQQAAENRDATRRRVGRQVHGWYVDQLHYRELAVAYSTMIAAADSTLEIARIRLEARAAPESHRTRALLEVYDLESARRDLLREQVRARAEMEKLFGGVILAEERLRGGLNPADDDARLLEPTAGELDAHPQMRAARLGEVAADATLAAARRARVPDLEVFVGYGRAHPDEGDFMEGGISLPLPLFQRNQGEVQAGGAEARRAHLRTRQVAHELDADLKLARENYRVLRANLRRLEDEIIPAARHSLTQAREGYRTGRLAFLELIDAQRTWNDVELRTLELRRDLALARADILALLGSGPYAEMEGTR